MVPLLLSLAAIGAAPLLDRALTGRPFAASAADAFAAVAVLATVLLHVLPHGIEALGPLALLPAVAGLLVPSLCELGGLRVLGITAIVGLGAHALVDGAMLAAPDAHEADHALAWAVVIHTVPLSLAVWRAARPHGTWLAAGVLGVTALSELVGWGGARALLDSSGALLAVLQCFTAGTLLHFVWAPAPVSRRGSGVGALLGGVAIVGMETVWPLPHAQGLELRAESTFLGLSLALSPALAAGLLGGAAIRAVLRAPAGARSRPPDQWDLPLGLLASLPLLGPSWLVARGVMSALPGLLERGLSGARERAPKPRRPGTWPGRLVSGFLSALRELADALAGRVLLGLALAAVLEPLVPPDLLGGLPPWIAVPAAALLGAPLGLGAVGVTPVAALLLHKGLPPAGVMALLLAGAHGGLSEGLDRAGALRSFAVTVAGAALAGALVLLLVPGLPAPQLHDVVARAGGPVAWVALGLTALLFADAVLRGGLPTLLGPLARPHRHDPEQGHAHAHAHDHAAVHAADAEG